MEEVLVRFTEPIRDDHGSYRAQASGAVNAHGLWEGWIEFVAPDGTTLRSPRETEQPNRNALMYWAEGLTVAYLEGALRRALDAPAKPANRAAADELTTFDEPSRDIRPRPSHSILDPFATYQQGEGVLRQQLGALSRDHLLTIVESYDLPVTRSAVAVDRDLIDGIVAAVARLEGPSNSQS